MESNHRFTSVTDLTCWCADCMINSIAVGVIYTLHLDMCAGSIQLRCRGTPEGPCVQKFASLAEARGCGGLEIVFNQQ